MNQSLVRHATRPVASSNLTDVIIPILIASSATLLMGVSSLMMAQRESCHTLNQPKDEDVLNPNDIEETSSASNSEKLLSKNEREGRNSQNNLHTVKLEQSECNETSDINSSLEENYRKPSDTSSSNNSTSENAYDDFMCNACNGVPSNRITTAFRTYIQIDTLSMKNEEVVISSEMIELKRSINRNFFEERDASTLRNNI
jgi:hypothetical protein